MQVPSLSPCIVTPVLEAPRDSCAPGEPGPGFQTAFKS